MAVSSFGRSVCGVKTKIFLLLRALLVNNILVGNFYLFFRIYIYIYITIAIHNCRTVATIERRFACNDNRKTKKNIKKKIMKEKNTTKS